MKPFVFTLALLAAPVAHAGTLNLATPHTIALNPPVYTTGCSAWQATTYAYAAVVTGFSSNGVYVLGQVAAYFTCGHSGRGSTVKTIWNCAHLQWDLSGNLTSATANVATSEGAPVSSYCPAVALELPSTTPPSNSVIGNEFTNAGGYVAETVIDEACGSVACYAAYYYPTLVTP